MRQQGPATDPWRRAQKRAGPIFVKWSRASGGDRGAEAPRSGDEVVPGESSRRRALGVDPTARHGDVDFAEVLADERPSDGRQRGPGRDVQVVGVPTDGGGRVAADRLGVLRCLRQIPWPGPTKVAAMAAAGRRKRMAHFRRSLDIADRTTVVRTGSRCGGMLTVAVGAIRAPCGRARRRGLIVPVTAWPRH
jgi:hypothetical protein